MYQTPNPILGQEMSMRKTAVKTFNGMKSPVFSNIHPRRKEFLIGAKIPVKQSKLKKFILIVYLFSIKSQKLTPLIQFDEFKPSEWELKRLVYSGEGDHVWVKLAKKKEEVNILRLYKGVN